jgi:adenylate kinase family enzyme
MAYALPDESRTMKLVRYANWRINRVVNKEDTWLIEGNYGSTLAPRLERADTVIYLDFPIRLCLARLIRRIATHRGQSRPDMPEGCPERFDLAFFWYVINWNTGPRLRTEAQIAPYADKVIRLRHPRMLAQWRKAHNLT